MDKKIQPEIECEAIKSISLAKGFHLYTQRNEWVDWDGATLGVNRSNAKIYFSLDEAKANAERQRTPGTKFFIDEVPFVLVLGETSALVLTELFTNKPLAWYDTIKKSPIKSARTIGALIKTIPTTKWTVCSLSIGAPSICLDDGTYYSRASTPGKGKNHMGWGLTQRNLQVSKMQGVLTLLQENLSCSTV